LRVRCGKKWEDLPLMGMEAGTRPGIGSTTTSAIAPREADAPRPPDPYGTGPGAGIRDIRPPAYGQGIIVSAVIGAAMLVLAITAIRHAENTGLPLTETTRPLYWGLAVLAVLAAGIGAQYAERTAARAAAAVEPWSAEPWLRLATVEQAAGNLEAARLDAARAIELTPKDFRPWLLASGLESKLGNEKVLIAYAARALALAPLVIPRAAADAGVGLGPGS
jgi:hypothetical protein